MRYASGTSVGEERSRAELQWLLEKFGADQFGFVCDRGRNLAKIMFRHKTLNFIFCLPLANAKDRRVAFTPSGRQRAANQIDEIMGQENRRRWRSLCLAIKAMLVGVEDGIFDFAEIFMPYMVWGDGRTVAQSLLPAAEEALKAGKPLPVINCERLLESRPAPAGEE